MIRETFVQGSFYPSTQGKIEKMIGGFLLKESAKISAKGIIIPHAGYVYSGKVASATVARVLAKKRVVILGPNHTGLGKRFSLWPKGSWKTPCGDILIDEALASDILMAGSLIEADTDAHTREHSIEVELPILKYYLKDFTFVPIACQTADLQVYRLVAAQLMKALRRIDDVLFVASTDMTHYEPEAQARKKDRDAIDAILELDEEKFFNRVRKENISMCGIPAVCILLACVKELHASKAQVVLYETSGQASGDCSSVVGYAGIVIN